MRHALHQSDHAKKLHEKGTSDKHTDKQKHKHTSWLLDQLGPEGLVGEKFGKVFGNQGKVANYTGCRIFLLSNTQHIFGLFQRFQQKNWCHILKSVLKVGDIMWTWNYIVRDILQVAVFIDHPAEATILTDLSMALSLLDAALGALALARWSQAMFYKHL